MIAMFRFATNFNNGGAEFGEKWKMDKVEWTWKMFWGAEKFNTKKGFVGFDIVCPFCKIL